MINIEYEFRRAFLFQKRWAKHCTTHSAHRAHSSTTNMIEPAQQTLEFINMINTAERTYKEKFEILNDYFIKQNTLGKNATVMGSTFYFDCIQYNKKALEAIENGKPVFVRKL